MSTEILVAKFEALPRPAQQQVEKLIDTLSGTSAQSKSTPGTQKRFSFDWAGGLEDLKDEFTSVELQHHIRALP